MMMIITNDDDDDDERRLFLLHGDTTIYILKTKVAPDFLGAYHVLFFLSL